MKDIIQSAGFIIFRYKNNEQQFLLLHYPGGHWDFPKGKVEFGESLSQAAARELYEETGLSVEKQFDFQTTFEYVFTERNGKVCKKEVTLFLAQVNLAPVVLSSEHVGYQWIEAERVLEKLTYQNARDAFTWACSYLKNVT